MNFESRTARVSRVSIPWLIAGAGGAAAIINVLVFGLGRLAGGTFEFTSSGESRSVDALTVAGFSLFPLALGLIVTAAVARSRAGFVRFALGIGVVLCVLTVFVMTIPADFDIASKITLSVCHVTLIPIIVVVLREIQRRAGDLRGTTIRRTVQP